MSDEASAISGTSPTFGFLFPFNSFDRFVCGDVNVCGLGIEFQLIVTGNAREAAIRHVGRNVDSAGALALP